MKEPRATRIWQIATGVAGLLAVTTLTAGAIYLATSNNDLRGQVIESRAAERAAVSNGEELYEQLIAEGIKPDAEAPEAVEPLPGDDGERGERGFRGDKGDAGDDGSDGKTGLAGLLGEVGPIGGEGAPGVSGPSGGDGADGADGTDGTDGADGPTGVGVAGVSCEDDGQWIFTLTNDTTLIVAGPCRVGVTPKEIKP